MGLRDYADAVIVEGEAYDGDPRHAKGKSSWKRLRRECGRHVITAINRIEQASRCSQSLLGNSIKFKTHT